MVLVRMIKPDLVHGKTSQCSEVPVAEPVEAPVSKPRDKVPVRVSKPKCIVHVSGTKLFLKTLSSHFDRLVY